MQRLLRLASLALVLPLAACDPAPVRGPSSEPVSWVESSRLQFAADAPRAEPPITVEPLFAGAGQDPVMPPDTELLTAFTDAAPEWVRVALVPDPESATTMAIVLSLGLDRFEPMLVTAVEGTDGVALLTTAGAALVLGSPFVAEFSPLQPLGLLQIDGQLVSGLQPHGYTRVLGFTEGRVGVVGRSAFNRGLFDSALQVGPGIIEQGKLDISKRELKLPAYFRTFLMSCGQTVVVGASTRPVHLRTLGQGLLDYATQQGLQCDEAVNFSGDREVLLGVRNGAQATVLGNPRVKKTALIGFRDQP